MSRQDRPGSLSNARMAYQFQKHYTRDEARELAAASPAVAEAAGATARRAGSSAKSA